MATMPQETIIFGRDGFIGKALAKRQLPPGIYSFDAPSSNILFDENLEWCRGKTLDDIKRLFNRCRKTGEYLVYPSSATIYNKNTTYAQCKSEVEEIAAQYPDVRSLGLRIAAGYGPGEAHKGRYASVIYQWCHQMANGVPPVIYGDGTQTRDFIFEDDLADTIARWASEGKTGVHDIGSGVNTSFNEVVDKINVVLGMYTDLSAPLKPVYVPKPSNYVPETPVKAVPTNYSLEDGIRKILLER